MTALPDAAEMAAFPVVGRARHGTVAHCAGRCLPL